MSNFWPRWKKGDIELGWNFHKGILWKLQKNIFDRSIYLQFQEKIEYYLLKTLRILIINIDGFFKKIFKHLISDKNISKYEMKVREDQINNHFPQIRVVPTWWTLVVELSLGCCLIALYKIIFPFQCGLVNSKGIKINEF